MGLIRDFQVAVRNVRRSPGPALTVALTVSVGVASIATVSHPRRSPRVPPDRMTVPTQERFP